MVLRNADNPSDPALPDNGSLETKSVSPVNRNDSASTARVDAVNYTGLAVWRTHFLVSENMAILSVGQNGNITLTIPVDLEPGV
jgi:hypothetical protein